MLLALGNLYRYNNYPLIAAAKIKKNEKSLRRRESDLRGALENTDTEEKDIKEKIKGRPSAKLKAETDYQLARAVDLLEGLALLKKRLVN